MVYILHMMYITLTGRGGEMQVKKSCFTIYINCRIKKDWQHDIHVGPGFPAPYVTVYFTTMCSDLFGWSIQGALINFSSRSIKYSFMRGSSLAWSYGSWIYNYLYAISAYHHWCCGLKSLSGRGVQHYVIKFVSDLRQVSGFLQFPPPIKLTATI